MERVLLVLSGHEGEVFEILHDRTGYSVVFGGYDWPSKRFGLSGSEFMI